MPNYAEYSISTEFDNYLAYLLLTIASIYFPVPKIKDKVCP